MEDNREFYAGKCKCKDCKHWGKEKLYESHMADGIDARECELAPFDIGGMKENDCAIMCGHDGGIYFGSGYGCINFEYSEGSGR